MKRLIEQTACEHGKWERHLVRLGPGRCHCPTCARPCPGGSSREITVDYIAATEMADDLLGKLTAHHADVEAIVDAALGDGS